MKKPLIVTIVILIILLIVPVTSLIKWTFQSKKPLEVLILDKTVPTLDRDKHRSLSWILTHSKFVKGNKRKYSYTKDYFGFIPLKPLRDKKWDRKPIRLTEIPDLVDSFDVAYFADTYGVYFNDWYIGVNRSNRSRMIYGGLNNSDFLFMMEMYNAGKLVIAEHNILDYPTEALNRFRVEELLDVKWTGWTGRYFESLDSIDNPDLPQWIINLYRDQNRKPWTFTKSGIIFLKNNNRVIVLESETHLEFEVPYIYTKPYGQEKYDLPYKVHYPYWFTIVEPGSNNVVSEFKIHPNEVGDSILNMNFLPSAFPAVLENPAGSSPYFYFAGDFADNPIAFKTAYFKGFERLKFMLVKDKPVSRSKFFWTYYKPLLTSILDSYYNEKKGE